MKADHSERDQRIVAAYRAGDDSPTIAAREVVTSSWVLTLARQAGCEMRGRRDSWTYGEMAAALAAFHREGGRTIAQYDAWHALRADWTPCSASIRNRGLWPSKADHRPDVVPPQNDSQVAACRRAAIRWFYGNGANMTAIADLFAIDIANVSRAIAPLARRPNPHYGPDGEDGMWARVTAGGAS